MQRPKQGLVSEGASDVRENNVINSNKNKASHSHLGQLITYAAGLDAAIRAAPETDAVGDHVGPGAQVAPGAGHVLALLEAPVACSGACM
jgi:hypothetical protein